MLEREFSDRTGFYPPADMYEIIESKYLEMDVDKDKFCEMYKNNDEDLAECIQMETDKATVIKFNEITKKAKEEKEALECRIRMLERGMKDLHAAKKFVVDSFGFNPDRVLIMDEYPKQEINRHGKIRNAKGEFYARKPLYESTDYNYILFSCAGIDYECVDGELYMLTD